MKHIKLQIFYMDLCSGITVKKVDICNPECYIEDRVT